MSDDDPAKLPGAARRGKPTRHVAGAGYGQLHAEVGHPDHVDVSAQRLAQQQPSAAPRRAERRAAREGEC
jgi:hypothetical protein